MEVSQEEVGKGREQSGITYSGLIIACEEPGQWKLALELFMEIAGKGCTPNTAIFDSLITAVCPG